MKRFLAGAISVLASANILACMAYLTGQISAPVALGIGMGVAALTPFYVYVWRHPDARIFSVAEWRKTHLQAWLWLLGLLTIDLVLGKIANSEATFWGAPTGTPGFLVTGFLSPLIPATMSGWFRAVLSQAMGL